MTDGVLMRLVTLVAAWSLAYLSLSPQLPPALCAVVTMSDDVEVSMTSSYSWIRLIREYRLNRGDELSSHSSCATELGRALSNLSGSICSAPTATQKWNGSDLYLPRQIALLNDSRPPDDAFSSPSRHRRPVPTTPAQPPFHRFNQHQDLSRLMHTGAV